ncbi:cupin-like domain-containing protein [Rheinheimera aquimaris]|jgi:hypothetical protein|uniref:cupin-like domain-containing protein n=1 Tax=Rheinheimera aquimaris TaxID=412437 RepID=UPI000E861CF0|nr:cupin-like domain-containing protein [Rheinheimera aquimaris]HBN89392.1 cupin [Rheinheimera sp.]|tara:strand:- start:13133 stop:14200 length:1068 start_codon:yes stop_codon:yes gene_type:complete
MHNAIARTTVPSLTINRHCRVIDNCTSGEVPQSIFSAAEPVVLKGLVSHWPIVQQGQQGNNALAGYINSHYNGQPTQVYRAGPGLNGRYFYNDNATALNFTVDTGKVDEVLQQLLAWQSLPEPPSAYIASNLIQSHFPTLSAQLPLQLNRPKPDYATEPDRVSIWLGNRSVAACHYDASENLACCVAGKRRFTLFPPEQVANLYPGPLQPTPGGQVISMVDFDQPDFERYPRFADAIAAGCIAELEPGDALYLPSMWWHRVAAPGNFNVLINYWWSNAPRYTGSGMNLLYHALLCLREKPEHERKAWQALLNYYVFDDPQQAAAHLPPAAQGVLGPLDDMQARQLRAMLLNRLNR